MRNLKKVLSLVLCMAMMLSVMVVGAGAAFKDQNKIVNDEAVDACAALNIINGYTDGSYRPEGNITRAEACKMICIALNGGKEPVLGTNATPTFTDTKGHWAEGYIESCVAQGIVAGIGGGKFNPNGNVTGSQFAKMLLIALGFNAQHAEFLGNAWEVKVNVVATQKDLYDGLETLDVSAALTRDNAAQMVWNALQAYTVEYDYTLVSNNGSLSSQVVVKDTSKTLLKDKYGADIETGVVVAVSHNSKGYTAKIDTLTKDKDNDAIYVTLTAMADDPTDLVGKAVKAMYKATDDVYGIYVDTDETMAVVETTVGDLTTSAKTLKVDGVEYDLDVANVGAVKVVDAQGATIDGMATVSDLNVSAASAITFIDNDGDEEIDIAVVTPVVFGEVTYLSSKNITVKDTTLSNAKLADCEVYDGIAKDDLVAVIYGKYVGNDNNVITKLDSVTGKIDATKNGEARIDGTWYNTAIDVSLDQKGEFFLYNGYIVDMDATSASISDTAYLISSGTTMDVDGNYQAKVLLAGETEAKLVTMEPTTTVKAGDSGKYVTFEIDDGVYEFTTITAGKMTGDFNEYTAASVNKYEDGRIYNGNTEYLVADDAVIYVKYTQGTDTKYDILTGKDIASWGDKAKDLGSSMVIYKTTDTMKKIQGAFIDLNGKMPASTASYGVIVSDVVSATDNMYEFTMWTGSGDPIEVSTSTSGLVKFQAVEYTKNSDGTYDVDPVMNGNSKVGLVEGMALYSVMDHTSNVVALANVNNAVQNYNITSDTQIIYVNVNETDVEDIIVPGGSIADAGTPDNGATYYRNVSFAIDEGSDLALLVVANNATGVMQGAVKK